MHNTIKHAAASEVRMKMTLDKSELVVSLQDNGHGFDLKIGKDGNGLANLKHRLEDIGGSVEVRSGLGQGTTVLLRMPFQRTTNAPRTKTKNSHDKTSSHRRG
jgi:two-component system sensor histidine kinase DegS